MIRPPTYPLSTPLWHQSVKPAIFHIQTLCTTIQGTSSKRQKPQRCPTSTTTSPSPQSANGTTTPTTTPTTTKHSHREPHAKPQAPSTRPPTHHRSAKRSILRNASEQSTISILPPIIILFRANPPQQQQTPPAKPTAARRPSSYHATSATADQPKNRTSTPSPGASHAGNRRASSACASARDGGLHMLPASLIS